MKLEGKEVKHKAFGNGIVREHIGNHITIEFSQGEKKFIYPDAFEKFITAIEESVNEEIRKDIANEVAAKKEVENQTTQSVIKEEKNTYSSSKSIVVNRLTNIPSQ